jgi:hypothetical protein
MAAQGNSEEDFSVLMSSPIPFPEFFDEADGFRQRLAHQQAQADP